MSLLPGAEFAPILTRTIIDLGPEGSDVPHGREIRWRADVTEPDDQRAIWRLAALALGVAKHSAQTARLAWQWTEPDGFRWCLLVGWFDASIAWAGGGVSNADLEAATAALCAHVWGPK